MWNGVGGGVTDTGVYSMAVDDSLLFAVGQFYIAGGILANAVAQWDGTKWDSVGPGLDKVAGHFTNTVCLYQKEIYAGGHYSAIHGGRNLLSIARWNGSFWDSVGSGTDGDVWCFAVYNGELYVGGDFYKAGKIITHAIAKWDGIKWDSVGGGVTGANNEVIALSVYNGKLYAGGSFTTAGGKPASNIACWDGTKWDTVSKGVTGSYVMSLNTYNGNLYAGGIFNNAGNAPVNNIAKWDGTKWSAVGAGLSGGGGCLGVYALCVYDTSLYAGGDFTKSGATTVMGIARWRDSVILADPELKIKNYELKIYPNPNNGLFQLKITNYELGITNTVDIYNMLGQQVYSSKLNTTTTELNLSKEAKGLYLYRVISESGELISQGKFIIE